MKVLRPGQDGSPLWYIGCVLSFIFLCAWEYFTIAMGAPWFFPPLWRRVAGRRSRRTSFAACGCGGARGRGGRGAGNRATAWGARYRGQSRVGNDPGFWLFPACHPVCGRIEYRSGSQRRMGRLDVPRLGAVHAGRPHFSGLHRLAYPSGEETAAARPGIEDTLAPLLLWPLLCHLWQFFHRRVSDCGCPAGATVVTLPVRRAARCHWRCLCRLRGAQAIQGCAGRGRLAAHLPALRGDGAGGRAHLPRCGSGCGREGGRGNLRALPSVKEGN